MKTWEGNRCIAPPFLTLGLYWGEWSESRYGSFTPVGKEPLAPLRYEVGWTPYPVWTLCTENSFLLEIEGRESSLYPVNIPTVLSRLSKKSQTHNYIPWILYITYIIKANKTPRPESARDVYRPRERRLSAKLVPTLADRGHHVVSVKDPYGHNLGFLDRSRYFSFRVALQLYSRGLVNSVPDPLLLRKSGSAGNRIWTSGSVALTTRPQRRARILYSSRTVYSTTNFFYTLLQSRLTYTKLALLVTFLQQLGGGR
jgi:hypothetical protein